MKEVRMEGRMEGWKDGRMEGWKDGRMEGWKEVKKKKARWASERDERRLEQAERRSERA